LKPRKETPSNYFDADVKVIIRFNKPITHSLNRVYHVNFESSQSFEALLSSTGGILDEDVIHYDWVGRERERRRRREG
jgi:hypothetical protein